MIETGVTTFVLVNTYSCLNNTYCSGEVAALGALIPALIEEGKTQKRSDEFGNLLGDTIQRYGIDGIENGTLADIPNDQWPGTSDTSAD